MKTEKEKPTGRPPNEVIDNRIKDMIMVLSNRPNVHRCQLHTQFCAHWNVSWKTVDRVICLARKEMMVRLQRSREDFRCESLAFYEAKINDPKSSVSEQLRARQLIGDLLGLESPKQIGIGNPDGSALKTVILWPHQNENKKEKN